MMPQPIAGYAQYVNQPGAYGASVAEQVQAMQQNNPEALLQTPIRISPIARPDVLMANAVGYAQSDLAFFDSKQDGILDRTELNAAFGGNTDLAEKYLKAYDIADGQGRKDGVIDIAEQTAAVLFQLNPTGQLAETMTQLAQNPVVPIGGPENRQALITMAQYIRQTHNTTPTNEAEATTISPDKRLLSEQYQQTFPTFVNQSVTAILASTGLRSQSRS